MLRHLYYSSAAHVDSIFCFFNDTATTEIYTLSLHDALPIFWGFRWLVRAATAIFAVGGLLMILMPVAFAGRIQWGYAGSERSEEHTSELQSRQYLVCRLLLEKKKYIT